jgi:hypothetical protein
MDEEPGRPRLPRWAAQLGLTSAAGLAAFWSAAAVSFSDALLVAALGCGAVTVAVAAAALRGYRTDRRVLAAYLAAGLVCVAAVGARSVTQASGYAHQKGRFWEVGFAFRNYADEHAHTFPPAARRGPDGRPLLSWRVLVLPHIGHEALYREFRLDEPWDSEHNLRSLPRMPVQYRPLLPSGVVDPPHTTRCQVLVGRGTVFEDPDGVTIPAGIPDGLSYTLLLIEARTPVPWTKPDDIQYDPTAPLPPLGPEVPPSLCGRVFGAGRPVRPMYMLADGVSVERLNPDWTDADIRKLIERDNGAPPDR